MNKDKAAENQALTDFVDLYLGDAISSVSDVGYVDLSEETLAETRSRWEAHHGRSLIKSPNGGGPGFRAPQGSQWATSDTRGWVPVHLRFT
ncbi:MAG: hypothetical protein H6517_07800 [Microthrixaceae bacterium]|nr:hypothetical protein [Microthrixaceae bacterium]